MYDEGHMNGYMLSYCNAQENHPYKSERIHVVILQCLGKSSIKHPDCLETSNACSGLETSNASINIQKII
jgi:hypothetical protein